MSQGPASPSSPAPAQDDRPGARAVIDMGATAIRLAIAEIGRDGEVRPLEQLVRATRLGADTFTTRTITRETTEQCVAILQDFQRMLREYRVDRPEDIRVVATSAVREARNQIAFTDRIFAATGLTVEPLDEAEVSRITYSSVQAQLAQEPKISAKRVLIVEVGGGSTEILVVKRGNVDFSQTFRLGAIRLRETMQLHHAPADKTRRIMTEQIRRTIDQIVEQAKLDSEVELIALGGDVRFAAHRLLPDWNRNFLARLPAPAVEEIAQRALSSPIDRLVGEFHLSFTDAETAGPALWTYTLMARQLGLSTILVSDANLRTGLMREISAGSAWSEDFREQVVRSAKTIGRRYDYDSDHAANVASIAVQLFRQLQTLHRLPSRFELHLQVAALLHEIGLYIGFRSHHKHTMYLIRNSELFGVGQRDLMLIAQAARYHRRASPLPSHDGFMALDRDGRVAVTHLAALLRVAVAVCDARSRRITEVTCSVNASSKVVLVTAHGVQDVSLERVALSQARDMFRDTFNRDIRLRSVMQ